MCGRATGWRGELRLAKLSLAVSDSFLPKRSNGGRRKQDSRTRRGSEGGKEDAKGPTVPLRAVSPRFPSRSPVRQEEPQISSFSSSCTQPALDLIAYPVFLLTPDFSAPSSLRLFLSFLLASPFSFSSASLSLRSSQREVDSKWKRIQRTRIEDRPNEDNSCIDCRGAWNGTSSARRPTSSSSSWLADSPTDWLT